MTTTMSQERDEVRVEFTVRRATDPEHLRELLSRDRAYAAYAIAQLETERFDDSECYLASSADGQQGLVVHSRSGLGRAIFADGDPEAVGAILSLHPGTRFTFGSLRPQHRETFERYFVLGRPQTMVRMVVSRQSFRTTELAAKRLGASDIGDINRLYSLEGGPAYYKPAHLEEGAYYGAYEKGRLVAIAGTHVVSDAEGVAVIGNVFTHPRYRGRALSTAVTGAATAELLGRCPLVVLTVEEGNESALAVYRRLGYAAHCTLHESPLVRKEPLGLFAAMRRGVAAWRGRATGAEVVVV